MTITTLIATLALAGVPAQTPKFPLNPEYQTPLDFGVPEAKFLQVVDTVVLNAVKSVRHEPGRKAAYWRGRIIGAVETEIAKLDFVPSTNLRLFLKALAGEVWVKSLVRYDRDIPGRKKIGWHAATYFERQADVILGDKDPRGTCTAFSLPVRYIHEAIVDSPSQQDSGTAHGDASAIIIDGGPVIDNHSWNYIRIGGRILQSNPNWTLIPRDEIGSMTTITKRPGWHWTLAGWSPANTREFLKTHWLPFGYKDRYWTFVGKEDAWTSLSFDEWKAIVTAKR